MMTLTDNTCSPLCHQYGKEKEEKKKKNFRRWEEIFSTAPPASAGASPLDPTASWEGKAPNPSNVSLDFPPSLSLTHAYTQTHVHANTRIGGGEEERQVKPGLCRHLLPVLWKCRPEETGFPVAELVGSYTSRRRCCSRVIAQSYNPIFRSIKTWNSLWRAKMWQNFVLAKQVWLYN